MEQLTERLTIRVSAADLQQIRAEADKQDRSEAWIAREAMKKGLKQMWRRRFPAWETWRFKAGINEVD